MFLNTNNTLITYYNIFIRNPQLTEKSQIFILDEPATALDAEHMEGFTRLLQMIKSQFKTVLLITHLDSLKDIVDTTIEIDKVDGYAHVNL